MKNQIKNYTKGTCLVMAMFIGTLVSSMPLIAQSQDNKAVNYAIQKSWYDLGMMSDPILYQSLLFYPAMTWSGQADVGECLETTSRVNSAEPDSWAVEWTKTADRLLSVAEEAEKQNHKVSAMQAYLRAATYYSAALHRHNNLKVQIVKDNTLTASKYFRKAIKILEIPAERVQIPYGNTTLPTNNARGMTFLRRLPIRRNTCISKPAIRLCNIAR